MRMEDMILVSTDDHIIEPRDMFKHHTPAKYKGRFPEKVRNPDGLEVWKLEDVYINGTALNAVAGKRPEELGLEPNASNEIRKGCYDIEARIDDLNVNGQLGTLNFGTWPGFAGRRFREGKDKELMYAILQAYNDWHIDEWCASHPERFIPIALLPTWSPELCAEEIKRVQKKGCHAASFIANPIVADLPSIHGDFWNPLWKAADENDVVLCLHIGDTTSGMAASSQSPYDVWMTCMGVSLFPVATEILWSPILRKYKNIKFALSEGGAGWVPACLERMDFVYKHHHRWTNQDFGDGLPSEVFKQHFYYCILDDEVALENRHRIGVDHITWECDYPHSDSLWPRAPEYLWRGLVKAKVPDNEINMITHLNSMKLFHWDPFKHKKREECTVGALRAQATHVDPGYVFDHDTEPLALKPTDKPRQIVDMALYMKYSQTMSFKKNFKEFQKDEEKTAAK